MLLLESQSQLLTNLIQVEADVLLKMRKEYQILSRIYLLQVVNVKFQPMLLMAPSNRWKKHMMSTTKFGLLAVLATHSKVRRIWFAKQTDYGMLHSRHVSVSNFRCWWRFADLHPCHKTIAVNRFERCFRFFLVWSGHLSAVLDMRSSVATA